jgi:enediyne biosynthesis protein E4
LSQHDLRIHFGLGSHDRVDRAEIPWPNGNKESLTNLAEERFYLVQEGPGISFDKPSEAKLKLP